MGSVIDIRPRTTPVMPVRTKYPWDKVFQEYFAMGLTRSYPPLAAKYGMSPGYMRRYAQRHKWTARVREMDAQAAAIAEEIGIKTWGLRIRDRIKTIDVLCGDFLDRAKKGEVKISPAEFAMLLKLEMQLAGVPEQLNISTDVRPETRRSNERLLALLGAAKEAGLLDPAEVVDGEAVEVTADQE